MLRELARRFHMFGVYQVRVKAYVSGSAAVAMEFKPKRLGGVIRLGNFF